MMGLALVSFVSIFAFGEELFHWHGDTGQIQLAMLMVFIFGIICGYKTRTSG